jgi:hypothetical protein
MADAMTRCLDRIVKDQKTKIGLGILYDALLFFKVLLCQETGTFFDNHLARRNAHALAWDILRDCPGLQSRTPEETNRHFRRFAGFLKNLAAQPAIPFDKGGWYKQFAVPLNERDQKTAADLRDFFTALLRKAAGENRY